MEYVNLVNKIIEAEHAAQEIAREVKEKSQTLDSDLAQSVAELREQYFARAKRYVEEVQKAETASADADMAAWDKKREAAMSEVESAYHNNREKWVDILFSQIIGQS